jgi:flagellar hook protein FlgE
MAIYTSLTGLSAASTDLSVISNNIANVGSNGFKKSRAAFGDLIGASALSDPRRTTGIGVLAKGVSQNFSQGSIQGTGNSLDLAITGNGLFVTESAQGARAFTRNGAFALNPDRFVVDGNGARLQVFPTAPDGTPLASGAASLVPLRIPESAGAPQPTGTVSAAVILPSAAPVIAGAFDPLDPASYSAKASTTVIGADGSSSPATIYYRRLTTPTIADPTSRWEVRLTVNGTEVPASGGGAAELTFDTNGALTAGGSLAFQAAGAPAMTIDHAGTAQRADLFSVTRLTQDGATPGALDSLTIEPDGLVRAGYTDGVFRALGRVALAQFPNAAALKPLGDARWSATAAAGAPAIGQPGERGAGSLTAGAIERSNVELTEELVSLIVAQRAFQANAKAIETDQAMTSAIVNLR